MLAQFWQSALSIVGMVTLIFAAIHYYRPHDVIVNDEQWSLSSLDKAPEPTQTIKRFDLIVETFFICLGLVVINQSTPFFTVDINTVVIPMIHMEYFAPYIIGINLLLGASLLLNMYLLFKGQWQAQTRVLSSFLDILGILLVAKLIFTPEIWDFSTISTALGEDADRILQLVQTGIYIGFAVFVIITLYEVFRHLKVLLESKKS
ncbi:hypothetical protein [Caldalkalibacillus mannanilyticus]|uniref:hypothetical protein n=1 Tax=Caldalkalibacillus mannanilyticus TaxID=1418 RepID=UPI00046916AB|nr:hypothetical protein [Caldalkalibacillus mannanilyticus]